MDSLQHAIDVAGGLSALAARLKVSPQVVANWRRRKHIPSQYLLQIERVSEGTVRVKSLLVDMIPRGRH